MEELTTEERLEKLEASNKQLEESDKHLVKVQTAQGHFLKMLEQDNSMCLYAFQGMAKKVEMDTVEQSLADYIDARREMLKNFAETLKGL